MIVGLNGCGKSTLCRALADALGFFCMDVEDYYFLPGPNPYAVSRSKAEVAGLMLADMRLHPRFVLASVSGDWVDDILSCVKAAVYLCAPLDVRLARIDSRSVGRFGRRVMPGGDMYEQERRFREFAAARTEKPIEDWLRSTDMPVLRMDATLPPDEILNRVIKWLGTLDITPGAPLSKQS